MRKVKPHSRCVEEIQDYISLVKVTRLWMSLFSRLSVNLNGTYLMFRFVTSQTDANCFPNINLVEWRDTSYATQDGANVETLCSIIRGLSHRVIRSSLRPNGKDSAKLTMKLSLFKKNKTTS